MGKASQLPAASALDGTETAIVVQDGVTTRTTTQDIADLGGGGGSTPTGTGFRHVTAGTEDAASAKVDLTASADVTVPAAGVVTSSGTALSSSATLPVSSGGTGASTLTSGGVLIGAGTGAVAAATNVGAGSGYVSIGATPSTTGSLRLPTGVGNGICGKSSGGADLSIAEINGSDGLSVWGTSALYGNLDLSIGSGAAVRMQGTTSALSVATTLIKVGPAVIGWDSPYSVHGGVKHTFASDANYTVTAAQYIYDYLKFSTGSWTANHTVTFPHPATFAAGYYKTVANNTTYVITVSTGTGTTVTLASGYAQRFFFSSDGVNAGAAAVIL